MPVQWRAMTTSDLPAVLKVADIVHVDYPESEAVFAERLALFPAGCWVASDGNRILGYTITHPGIQGKPPALDSLLVSLPDTPDCLYMHDVALLPEARQHGLGSKIVGLVRDVARTLHLPAIALVAVNGSVPYWQGRGFAQYTKTDTQLRAKLASYTEDAAYLVMAQP